MTEDRLTRWLIGIARLGWTVLAIVVAVKCVVRPDLHSDFPIYWDTGRDWWFPGQIQPFSPQWYVTFINRQMAPFLAESLAPFCILPMTLGGVLWSLTGLAGLYWALTAGLRKLVPDWSPAERAAVLVMAPWCGLHSLYNGQLNVPIAAFLLAGTAAVACRRWAWAGLLLALPVHTKTYPIALGMVLSALYPRRLLPAFALAMFGLGLAPFATHPADVVIAKYQGWFQFLVNGENYSYHPEFGFDQQDVRLLVSTWIKPIGVRAFLPVQVATGALVLACALWRRRRTGDDADTLVYAYVLCSMWLVLFGPCTQTPTYLLAGPAVSLLLVDAYRRRVPTWMGIGLFAAATFAGPLQTSILGMTVWRWVQNGRLGALGLLVLFAYQAARCLTIRAAADAVVLPFPTIRQRRQPLRRAA